MRSPTFLGLSNVGPTRSQSASMSWQLTVTGDDVFGVINSPILSTVSAWVSACQFQINPQNNQGSFDFGNIRKLVIAVQRPRSWWVSDVSNYLPGRILIQLPATGETLLFTPQYCAVAADLDFVIGGFTDTVYEGDFKTLLTWLSATSPINIFMESDIQNGAYVNPDGSVVSITAFNFNPDIV